MKIIEIDINNNVNELEIQGNIGEQIKKRLNGWIEIVNPKGLDSRYVMVVDEEGLLKELNINLFGSYLYETDKHGHPIVGNIYIGKLAGDPYNGYDIGGLDEEDIRHFNSLYQDIIKRCRNANKNLM